MLSICDAAIQQASVEKARGMKKLSWQIAAIAILAALLSCKSKNADTSDGGPASGSATPGTTDTSGLAKEQAESMLRTRFATRTKLECMFKEPVREEGSGTSKSYVLHESEVRQQRCMAAMQASHFIAKMRTESGGLIRFDLTDSSRWYSDHVMLTCGTTAFGSVVSVTTSGNRAQVKFQRMDTLDRTALDKLKDCTVNVGTDGQVNITAVFQRDDSGNWSIVSA